MNPAEVEPSVIPHSLVPRERASTSEDQDLVPRALINFQQVKGDFVVFRSECCFNRIQVDVAYLFYG